MHGNKTTLSHVFQFRALLHASTFFPEASYLQALQKRYAIFSCLPNQICNGVDEWQPISTHYESIANKKSPVAINYNDHQQAEAKSNYRK